MAPAGFKADGADLALVQVEVTDAEGRRCPTDLSLIHFDLNGPAEWRGGMAQGPDNYIGSKDLPVECGINRVLIRSTAKPGKITLTASATNLRSATLSFTAHPFPVTGGLAQTFPGDQLPSYLGRGPTPATPAIKLHCVPLKIVSSTAGANPELAANAYDDNETTDWHNDSALTTAWIEYHLQSPSRIDELVLKLNNFRTRGYPLSILIDGKPVWSDTTQRNLGYTHIRFASCTGSAIRIRLTSATDNPQLSIIETEIYGRD
jgi:hypothetical protein